MLDYAIAFVLGFLVAGLLSFAFLPAVWARALRLTRRQLEASIPISMAEVRAGRDLVRAEAALDQRRIEEKFERERERRYATMAENGRLSERVRLAEVEREANGQLLGEATQVGRRLGEELASLRDVLDEHKTDLAAARVALADQEERAMSLRRDVERLRAVASGHADESTGARQALEATRDEITRLETELAEMRDAMAEREGFAVARDETLARNDDELTDLGKEVGVLQKRLEEAKRTAATLRDEKERLLAEQRSLEQRVAELSAAPQERAATGLPRVGGEADQRIETLEAEKIRLQAEITRIKREEGDWRREAERELELLRGEVAHLSAGAVRGARTPAPLRRTGERQLPQTEAAGKEGVPSLAGAHGAVVETSSA